MPIHTHNKQRDTLRVRLLVAFTGLFIMVALNAMMLFYHHDVWTSTRFGAYSVFRKYFEVSGFDPFTYIIVTTWRPLYALPRHPLLAAMLWPLSELNAWIKSTFDVNAAIYIVGAVWTLASWCSWMLMYKILRRIMEQTWQVSLLLTLFFFSFAHVMLTIFTPDHMTLTLPLLLLAIYLSGRAIQREKPMPLWQSLPLALLSAGVTTTNIVKVWLADMASQWGHKKWGALFRHSLLYLLPLSLLAGAFFWQQNTVMVDEQRMADNIVRKRAARDSVFAKKMEEGKKRQEQMQRRQIIDSKFVAHTEHVIDRWPSVYENMFGEGFILHTTHTLKDANQSRPKLVHYTHWGYYLIEALLVSLFIAGLWASRGQRLMLAVLGMLLFDLLLHVGLNFASADLYIMTVHWAFIVPMAVACLLQRLHHSPRKHFMVLLLVGSLTVFMWCHNVYHTAAYILQF